MADGASPPGAKFTFLDYLGLAFILVGGEEILRRPKEGWPIWIPGLALGLVALLFRDRSPRLLARLLAWFRAPKQLSVALAENTELKKQLAKLTPSSTSVPALSEKPKELSKLIIHAADYRAWNGAGEKFDVTEFMQKIITGNTLVHGPIENDSFWIDGKNYVPRDPLFGQAKRLQVTYSYGGEAQRTVQRTEHGRITLPEDSAIDWLGSELEKAKTEAERWKRTYAESESANNAIRELIAKDVANLKNRIQEHKQRIEFHFSPSSDPYLDIATELWNGSVFDLVSFGEIAGHVTYAGKQLAGDPRVVVSVEPTLLNLRHGESATLVVRQYLSSQVADAMVASHGRGVAIDCQSVFVSFKVVPKALPLDGTTKIDGYKWQGPRFAIEDAKRV